ncbi:phosphatidate cytidylyltransferase [Hansschlegelia beijingensis]|uniref:Phosphatidate cytidylyltransferase n=1 Tax=Hansschlegelia beijingensis TaxID=1133344 RepID=A0A7W6D720_9HYPH|nr:phosphatidate cytidylyltransferase [Hansschlegelia beijingensis]
MTEAPQAARSSSELAKRVVSGVVMIAAALLSAWIGGLLFAVFWTLAGVAVGVEWAWLSSPDPRARRRAAQTVGLTLGVAGALVGLASYFAIPFWVIAAALAIGAAAAALLARPVYVTAAAVPYGAAVFIGVILLRRDPHDGLLATLWLFAVVWATDIAAYFTGRAIGGPKLAPRISPKKTWSGAVGGAAAAACAGVGVAALGGVGNLWPVALVALVTAVLAELGDLFESGVKRAFGAKDSSQLIPGHGGLMDRLDGFLVAATFVAAVGLARGGLDGAGQGLLRW